MSHKLLNDSAHFGARDKAYHAGLDSLADQSDSKDREELITGIIAVVAVVATFFIFHFIGA